MGTENNPTLAEMLQNSPMLKLAPDITVKEQLPRIVCVDGTSLSVQASRNHYCTPRNDKGPYTHVEVGYPSIRPPQVWIDEYCEDPSAPLNTVYPYIPIELVLFFIAAHGGIDHGASLQ